MKFSVLITTYHKDHPGYLKAALQSLLDQTVCPDEIILVKDGPLPNELEEVITEMTLKATHVFRIVALPENVGHSPALNAGLRHASYELVARMDADDIAAADRFQKQLGFFERNPDYAVLGGQVEEFMETPGDAGLFRHLPLTNEDLM